MAFGAPYLRKLKKQAEDLGILVDFWLNSDGVYVVKLGLDAEFRVFEMPSSGSAACACHFIMGIIALADKQQAKPGCSKPNIAHLHKLIRTDDRFVGDLARLIYDHNKEKDYHSNLFKCISDWVRKGNIPDMFWLKRGREALLLHYDEVLQYVCLEKDSVGICRPAFRKE